MKRWVYSIQTAMLLSFSAITLTVISIALAIAYRFSLDEMHSVSVDYVSQLVSQVNAEIDRYVGYMEDVAEVVSKNSAVLQWIGEGSDMGIAQLLVLEDSVQNQMSGIVNVRRDITNIAVFAEPSRAVFDTRGKSLNPFADYRTTDWYQGAMWGQRPAFITSSHVQNVVDGRYDWVVTMSKSITESSGDVRAVLMIDLNYSLINNLCQSVDMGSRGYIYVVDSEGNIMYHPQQQLIYSHIKSERIAEVLGDNKQTIIHSDEGDKLYIANLSDQTGWTVIGVAYQDEILRNRGDIIGFYVVIFAVFLGIAILLSAIICSAITGPLKRLVEGMQNVQSGGLDTRIHVGGPREVSQLGDAFNTMIGRLQELISQRERDQEQRRKSELKALQAQINPHFLYNTLDSIIWMAENDNSEEVVEMTAALAGLFRSSISENREIVPLATEIANTRSYLTIQKMRYGDKLRYSIDIPAELMNCLLPRQLLQPLVENAIYHGIKPREGGGEITVSAETRGNLLILLVHDDGVGMSPAQLEGILQAKPDRAGNGIGVKNVHERIRLTFGKPYGLFFESLPGAGTTVRVSLPLMREVAE